MLSIQVQNLLNKKSPKGTQYIEIVVKKLCSEFISMNEIQNQGPKIDKKLVQKVNGQIIKYLDLFSFEVGCDLPTQEQVSIIYSCLFGPQKSIIPQQNRLSKNIANFQKLIYESLMLYAESKKSSIGGIMKRLVLKMKAFTHQNM